MQLKTPAMAVLAAGACLALACRPASEDPAASLESQLMTIVEGAVAGHEADFGAALHVDAPRLGLAWEGLPASLIRRPASR